MSCYWPSPRCSRRASWSDFSFSGTPPWSARSGALRGEVPSRTVDPWPMVPSGSTRQAGTCPLSTVLGSGTMAPRGLDSQPGRDRPNLRQARDTYLSRSVPILGPVPRGLRRVPYRFERYSSTHCLLLRQIRSGLCRARRRPRRAAIRSAATLSSFVARDSSGNSRASPATAGRTNRVRLSTMARATTHQVALGRRDRPFAAHLGSGLSHAFG